MSLILKIEGDSRDVRNDVKRTTKSVTTDVRKMERTSVSASQKMSGAFGGLRNSLGALGIGIGVVAGVRGIGSLISQASDLTESMNKVKEVFEGSADSIIAFSEKGATALGASQQQTLAMTGEIGNLLVAMGSTSSEAAGMSKQVVQLAADLGSFNNVPTAEALNAIRAALVGETEPIRRFGSDVRVTRLEQIALAKGIDKATLASSSQTKAMIALEAIFKDTQKAQGDFARTSDQLANSSKILAAQWKDFTTNLGQVFIPLSTEVVAQLNLMISTTKGLSDGTKEFDTSFKQIVGGILSAIPGFEKLGVQMIADEIAAGKLGIKTKETTEAIKEQTEAIKERAVSSVATPSLELPGVSDRQDPFAQQIEVWGRGLDETTRHAGELATRLNQIPVGLQQSVDLTNTLGTLTERQALAANATFTFVTGIANSLAMAVAQGQNLAKTFEQLIKQLASKALVGLLGGVIGGLLVPGVGFGAGFALASGFQHGGSAIVPGTGSGDRPFMMNLAPGERVDVTPRGQVNSNNRTAHVTLNIYPQRLDENYVRTGLAPMMKRLMQDGNVNFGMA